MVKNKLHIIGCSFSTHRFFDLEPGDYPNDPSNYARIVANNLNLEPEAYAREGQGNSFMLNCLKQYKDLFNKDDVVLVQMSQPERLDNSVKHFGNIKVVECLNPTPETANLFDVSIEDLKTFGYVYDKCFRDDSKTHDLYCDAIIAECFTLPCKSIVLPLLNKEEYTEKYADFDKISIGTNPWNYWQEYFENGGTDNVRFDHLDDAYHNKCGHQITKEVSSQGLIGV